MVVQLVAWMVQQKVGDWASLMVAMMGVHWELPLADWMVVTKVD